MIFEEKKLSFVHKVLFPKTMLFGEKGEALLKTLYTGQIYLFISESFYKTHLNDSWINGKFLGKVVYSKEPTKEDIDDFAKEIKKAKPRFVTAIGGGSVMDLAKLSRGRENITFIVMPTTLGSGAEVSQHAVFTDKGAKKSLSSALFLPDLVIVNPKHFDSLTREQIVLQSIDGVAHALESLVSKMSHQFSDDFALRAIQIFHCSFRDLQAGKDIRDEVSNFHRASILSGLAQSSVGVGLAHALAHVLGPLAGIPHAEAVAMFLFDVLEINLRQTGVYKKMYSATGISFEDFLDGLRFFYQKMEPRRLVLKKDQDIKELAQKVRREVNFFTNPYLPNISEIIGIIEKHL